MYQHGEPHGVRRYCPAVRIFVPRLISSNAARARDHCGIAHGRVGTLLAMANAVDNLGWKLMSGASAAAAAAVTRKAALKAYQAGYGEDPPKHITAPQVPLKQALMWAVLSGMLAGLVRFTVLRMAAAAWVRARGELPPTMAEKAKHDNDNDNDDDDDD
jgi:hypothetical protein